MRVQAVNSNNVPSTVFSGTFFFLTSKSVQGQILDWQARTSAGQIQPYIAGRSELKPSPNASPGRVTSSEDVMTGVWQRLCSAHRDYRPVLQCDLTVTEPPPYC